MRNIMDTREWKNAVTMAERVYRATGVEGEMEEVGGGMVVSVFILSNRHVVVVHPEGWSVYSDILAWQNGADPIHQDAGTPWEILLNASEYIREHAATVTMPRAVLEYLHTLADLSADEVENMREMHPTVDTYAVVDMLVDALADS